MSAPVRGPIAPLLVALLAGGACKSEPVAPPPAPKRETPPEPPRPAWEVDSPLTQMKPTPPGTQADLTKLKFAVNPSKVRLGRWLFFDKRLSSDGTVSCATCHRPENAFSEPTAHSTGVRKQEGARKSPSFV